VNSEAKKFVVQQHIRGGETHWDLMLEHADFLKTWRLAIAPQQIGSEPTPAEKIVDHDVKFLTYQGSVNNGQGSICIVDEGTIETLDETKETIRLRLLGKILSGEFVLEHIKQNQWRFFRN
jgi:bifunctional non-homologous end joining protein LigD